VGIIDFVLFFISIGVGLGAVFYTFKHYLSPISRFEDYYFLLSVICALAYFIGEAITLLTGNLSLDLVILANIILLGPIGSFPFTCSKCLL
jgi:hypothetical protein